MIWLPLGSLTIIFSAATLRPAQTAFLGCVIIYFLGLTLYSLARRIHSYISASLNAPAPEPFEICDVCERLLPLEPCIVCGRWQ